MSDETLPVLDRDQILRADDRRVERVPVPEWGGAVFCRGLTGSERDAYESGVYTGKGVNLVNVRARLCALGMCDANGKTLFNDADIILLAQKNAAPLDRCYDKIRDLSGMTPEDVEELEKNLEPAPGVAS